QKDVRPKNNYVGKSGLEWHRKRLNEGQRHPHPSLHLRELAGPEPEGAVGDLRALERQAFLVRDMEELHPVLVVEVEAYPATHENLPADREEVQLVDEEDQKDHD
ncbi:MAG: hypothetical protein Q9227_003488, partial [Pyrenula ochraceoflavens]